MGRPRLLFLSTRFPFPTDRGDRLRAHHFVREFSRHADVTLVAFTDADPAGEPIDALRAVCARIELVRLPALRSMANMALEIPGRTPFQVAYYRSGAMARVVDRLARERWDVAFGFMLRMEPYLARLNGTVGARILDLNDSIPLRMRRTLGAARFPMRLAYAQELRRADRYERRAARRVDECWLTAAPDRDEIAARVPDARFRVVPNGAVTRWGHAGLEGPKEEEVLFLGNMTVQHNRDAARHLVHEVWPRVRARRPRARLRLIGVHGPGLRSLHRPPDVALEGYVDDLAPYLRRARVAVAPLRVASGLQNKVIETMAAGLPAVVTPIVAEPIGAPAGEAIVTASDPDAIAAEVARLLADDGAARAIGAAGADWVRRRFDWSAAGDVLAEVLAR